MLHVQARVANRGDWQALRQWAADCHHFGFVDSPVQPHDGKPATLTGLMKRDDSILLIGTVQNLRVGAVLFRMDDEGQWHVSAMIKPAYAARGLLAELVLVAVEAFRSERVGAVDVALSPRLQALMA